MAGDAPISRELAVQVLHRASVLGSIAFAVEALDGELGAQPYRTHGDALRRLANAVCSYCGGDNELLWARRGGERPSYGDCLEATAAAIQHGGIPW